MYVNKIENERRKIEELDKAILKYQEKILEQNARLGGMNASQVNNQMIQKQIKVLENRLDKCLLKFNETLAQNKILRKKIDEYRRERVVFDGIYKKLERELHEKKKEMAAIIEDSKNAYQARDKAQSEMAALQQHADKERTEFEGEFKELGELIKSQQSMLEQLRLRQFENGHEEQTATALTNEEDHSESVSPLGAWANTKDKSTPLSQEKITSSGSKDLGVFRLPGHRLERTPCRLQTFQDFGSTRRNELARQRGMSHPRLPRSRTSLLMQERVSLARHR